MLRGQLRHDSGEIEQVVDAVGGEDAGAAEGHVVQPAVAGDRPCVRADDVARPFRAPELEDDQRLPCGVRLRRKGEELVRPPERRSTAVPVNRLTPALMLANPVQFGPTIARPAELAMSRSCCWSAVPSG